MQVEKIHMHRVRKTGMLRGSEIQPWGCKAKKDTNRKTEEERGIDKKYVL